MAHAVTLACALEYTRTTKQNEDQKKYHNKSFRLILPGCDMCGGI